MSIKDQLRAAILSGSAKGASPTSNFVEFSEDTFVAPADGYVCFSVRSVIANQWLSLRTHSMESVQSITQAGQNPCVFIPVSAGQTVYVMRDGSTVVNSKRFVKLVGG